MFPVHTLSDRFNNQIATSEYVEVVFVISDFDQSGIIFVAQRSRIEFFQVVDRTQNDAVFLSAGRSNRTTGTLALTHSCNLRTHNAGAENSDFFNDEIGHF
jgi:hypothetical protein